MPKRGPNVSKVRVDRELLRRFTVIAKPYFYPIDGGGAGWGVLVIGLLVGVAGLAYWFTAIAVWVLLAHSPPDDVTIFETEIPDSEPVATNITANSTANTTANSTAAATATASASALELQNMMSAQPWPLVALACLAIAAGLAFTHRRQLRGRWRRWATLALLLLLLLSVTCIMVLMSYAFRGINNTLHKRHEEAFYDTVLYSYGGILFVAVPVYGLYKYTRMKLAREWRGFLCQFFLQRYLSHQAYYQLDSNSADTQIDNPDQRITEDVSYFTEETLDFILDVLDSIIGVFTWATVLWATSARLTCILVVYASFGTVLAFFIGRRLVSINYEQLRREADLRYSLIRVRENAESIAFYSGEALESEGIHKRLDSALHNYDLLITWSTFVNVYTKSFFFLARLGPYLAIAPLYLAKEVDFGTFTQSSMAFRQVLSSVTLIISRIKDISRFAAGINRLGAFYDALAIDGDDDSVGQGLCGKASQTTEEKASTCFKRRGDSNGASIAVELMDSMDNGVTNGMTNGSKESKVDEILSVEASAGMLEIKQMSLQTPTGRVLIEGLNLALNTEGTDSPRRLLIVGPSGVGKSSVLRAIAGLWSKGGGEIHRPPRGEMLFLPQKPYMPLGDLRMQLLYPNIFADTTDEAITETLSKLSLGDLPQRFDGGFDAVQDWGRVLSVGEQQRLAAARCLLTSPTPSFLVLDEATSALPVQDEAVLYGLLWERNVGYISVGHRESLHQYHDLVLELSGEGAWRLRPPDTEKFCDLR